MTVVLTASGHAIDWANPPKPNAMCTLSLNGHSYKGSLRTCAHMHRLDHMANKQFGQGVTVIQSDWNTGVAASVGTHDFDSVWDVHIAGVGWWEQQKFFRANGFACWYRHPPAFGNHIHGFTLPPHSGTPKDDFQVAGIKVGKWVDGGLSALGKLIGSSQIEDFYFGAFGLAGQHAAHSDKSWRPSDIPSTIFDLPAYIKRRAAEQKAAK